MFHSTLQENIADLNLAILKRIDEDLDCTKDPEHEVKSRWYPVGINLNYGAVLGSAFDWVSSIGRLKFLRPVYAALKTSQPFAAVHWF